MGGRLVIFASAILLQCTPRFDDECTEDYQNHCEGNVLFECNLAPEDFPGDLPNTIHPHDCGQQFCVDVTTMSGAICADSPDKEPACEGRQDERVCVGTRWFYCAEDGYYHISGGCLTACKDGFCDDN